MINSPTMCQYYITKALEPMKKQFPDFLIIHYIDDILFSAPSVYIYIYNIYIIYIIALLVDPYIFDPLPKVLILRDYNLINYDK